MHRYFKKLATESFPSTSAPENSPLNQETDEHNTQTQTSNFDANTNLLVTLALLLLVSTSTIERVFSAMKIINTNLRNRISDEFLNDTIITYFEDDLFETVSNDDIMYRFQNMKVRRGQLS